MLAKSDSSWKWRLLVVPALLLVLVISLGSALANPQLSAQPLGTSRQARPLDDWAQMAPYPIPIYAQACVSIAGIVLDCFGGITSDDTVTAMAFQYYLPTNTWTRIADLPEDRAGASAVSDGMYVYILNGSDGVTGPRNTVYRYDTYNNAYEVRAAAPLATELQGAVDLDGVIYRVGGQLISGMTNSVDVYNVSTNTWAPAGTIANYPQTISSLPLVTFGGYIYGIGGNFGMGGVNKTYRYDPLANTWDDAAITDLPNTREGATAAIVDTSLVVAGGAVSGGNSVVALPMGNPAGTWLAVAPMPQAPRLNAGYGMLGIPNALYVVGGWDSYQPTQDNQSYTGPPTGTATPTIPPGDSCPDGYADLPPGDPDFAYAHCANCTDILQTFECGHIESEPCIPPDNYPYFQPATGFVGTRGEVALSVSNAAGFQDTPSEQQFEDIAIGSIYYPYTYRLAVRNIEVGFPCGSPGEPCGPNNLPYYRPHVAAVRGEFTRFVSNAAGFDEWHDDQMFEDVPPGSNYYIYVERVASRNLMQGFPCGGPGEPCSPNNLPYFRPRTLLSTVSRSEIAHILVDTFLPSCPLTTPTPSMTPTVTPTNTPVPTRTATETAVPTDTPTSTITPTTEPTACPIQFTDVPQGSTFYAYVRCLACRGYVSGYACGGTGEPCNPTNDPYFRPNNNVTRGQLSKIISNAAGFNDPPGAQLFEDVPPDSTFFDFIYRLANRGYMSGYPCGGPGEPCGPNNLPYFRPNSNATRGQISKIVSNAAGFNDPPGTQLFEDVLPGSTFYDFIQRLASRSIMSGYPCGGPGEPCGPNNFPYFRPNSNATRGQTSKIVANTFFPICQTPGRK